MDGNALIAEKMAGNCGMEWALEKENQLKVIKVVQTILVQAVAMKDGNFSLELQKEESRRRAPQLYRRGAGA